MTDLKVSFIIPNFNYGRFLAAAIDSCLAQAPALPNAQIIVMDGGSSDDSVAIMQSYGNRIEWQSQRDRGQSDAVNRGIALATGDIIAWVNSDDFYPNTPVLHRLLEHFADPAVELVYGDGELVDAAGKTYRPLPSRPDLSLEDLCVGRSNPIFQPTALFRRKTFLKLGGLREELHFAMDLDLWIRLLLAGGRMRHVPVLCAYGRVHGSAKTRSQIAKTVADVYAVKRLHLRRLDPSPRQRARLACSAMIDHAYIYAVKFGLVRPPV